MFKRLIAWILDRFFPVMRPPTQFPGLHHRTDAFPFCVHCGKPYFQWTPVDVCPKAKDAAWEFYNRASTEGVQ